MEEYHLRKQKLLLINEVKPKYKNMDEEAISSPVKFIKNKYLEVKSYNCIICDKRAGKDGLRTPTEKGIVCINDM